MSYIIIPIAKLHMEHIIKLGDFIFFPSNIFEDALLRIGSNISNSDLELVKKIYARNSKLMEQCTEKTLVLAVSSTQFIDDPDQITSIAQITVERINRSMDSLRIELCRFDRPEQLPGIPGVVGNNRVVFVIDSKFQYKNTVLLSPIYYNMQPGIGLDIDDYGMCSDESLEYQTLNLQRNDEVYLEFRSIVAQACDAMHIMDTNRCFVYLFNTVERMMNRGYARFTDKKKRILSFIAETQEEYDTLSDQFYFYSKYVRTEIIHKGENILNFISFKNAIKLLTNLMLLIIRFSLAVIKSGITQMSILDQTLQEIDGIYEYKKPSAEFEMTAIEPIYGDLDGKKHTFIAEVRNLWTEKVLKLGDVILLPVNSIIHVQQFYWFYVYLDRLSEDPNHKKFYSDYNIDEELYAFDLTTFYDADDLEIIYECLHYREIQEMNSHACIALIKNHPWLKEGSWSPINYTLFADYLCDDINQAFSYMLILRKAIPGDILPSRVGIPSSGIRAVYRLDEHTDKLHTVLGRIYEHYVEPDGMFELGNIDSNFDESLFYCLYKHHGSNILKKCQAALNRIVECLYFADLTVVITYMFDILDMLDPESTEGDKLKSNVIPFISNSKEDYYSRCDRFREMRSKYRNPLLHQGKSIYELTSSKSEIIGLFGEIRDIIVLYCKSIYALRIQTQEDFILKRSQQQHILNI